MRKARVKQLLSQYEFDLNDIRALIMLANVLCVFLFGLSVSVLGLAVAVVGLVNDVLTKQKINHCLIHFSTILLNLYFMYLAVQ